MVIPVGDSEQSLLLIQKKIPTEDGIKPAVETTEVTGVSFVPMVGSVN